MPDLTNPAGLPLPRAVYDRAGSDGYEVAGSRDHGWHAVPAWGRDGWDLGEWPYVVVMHRDQEGSYVVLTYVEGDVTVEAFPTRQERDDRTDGIAAFYWRHNDENWIRDYPEGEPLPAHLRGPSSWSRLDAEKVS